MKIAIAGYGVEGEENYRYFSTLGHDVTIVDEREAPTKPLPEDAKTLLGEKVFSRLEGFDMVVRTAGLAPRKINTDGRIWSATNEFFAKCPAPIIGVTGTKGKGTTCSLITSILRAAGKTVHLVGNIGTPALEVLSRIQSDDIVVYELSSFQLWDLEKSPHVAVVLMIEPDHLDVHADLEEYIVAKASIVKWQKPDDVVIYNTNNDASRRIGQGSAAQKMPYPFAIGDLANELVIPGAHNIENASAAIAAVAEWVQDRSVIAEGLRNFTGLPHRLKFVREVDGVKFYDDSIATTPGSAIAAIASFEQPTIILLGGHDKGADYRKLIETCRQKDVTVFAYGANRDVLKALCDKVGVRCYVDAGTMKTIVVRAAAHASAGTVIILSPAAASFDMFKSYADRGDQFISAVNQL